MNNCSLDRVIIVDTNTTSGRADEVATIARQRGVKNVDVIAMKENDVSPACEAFSLLIRSSLENKECVMVICNCIAGVRGGIISILLEAERDANVGTRRVIFSCFSSNRIKKGFAQRGIPREKFYHVKYDAYTEYLRKFYGLLEG